MEEEHFEKSHLSIQQQAKRQLEEEEAHLVESEEEQISRSSKYQDQAFRYLLERRKRKKGNSVKRDQEDK